MATPVHLVSPLPLRDCVDRLRVAIKLSCYREPTLDGKVTDESVLLWKAIYSRNSFLPVLRGKWQPVSGGTLFRGSVGMHPFVKIFMAVWYCFTGLAGIGIWVSVMQVWASGAAHPDPDHVSNSGALLLLIFPFGMWLFATLIVLFGRWLSRGQTALLIAFFAEAIQGQQVPPAGTPSAGE